MAVGVSVMDFGVKIRVDDIEKAKNMLEYIENGEELVIADDGKLVKVRSPSEVRVDIWIFGSVKTDPLR